MKRHFSGTTWALIVAAALSIVTGTGLMVWGVLVDEGLVPSANIAAALVVFSASVIVAVGLLFVSAGREVASGMRQRR